ncbi:MAG TPA: phosphoribosylanthranilate isomerase [Kiritimatiellia bacterium]|nr:phosphoribosylanthranilate isomerase [Kiritimatiellia bacterium]
MDVFVKICGVANLDDLREVAALKPDALGFVLWPDSPRFINPDDLIKWLPMVSTDAMKVGVFVNPEPRSAIEIMRKARLDVIQLHGDGSIEPYVTAGFRVWKAVHADRMKNTDNPGGRIDAYVADTYSKELPGGTGKVGNWEAVRTLVQSTDIPVILAGGLNPSNVRSALRAVNPWGVDVSSGVEAGPGKKNINSVREFILQCRNM